MISEYRTKLISFIPGFQGAVGQTDQIHQPFDSFIKHNKKTIANRVLIC